jgi:hypothetical protein
MKKTVLIFCLISISKLWGQNLVPNPSFELKDSCPYYLGEYIDQNWFTPTSGTPESYSSCSINGQVDVPLNYLGYQFARTGNCYVGIGTSSIPDTTYTLREYISTQLTQRLDSDEFYCVTFYVSLAGNSKWAIDKIGAFISDTMHNHTWGYYIQLDSIPQIESASGDILLDSINWIEISGIFKAKGNEEYITIGNFHTNQETNYIEYQFNSWATSYYYIDDVSVEKVDKPNTLGNQTICFGDSVQIGSLPQSNSVYEWHPGFGLSDSTIANPKASPEFTTQYIVTKFNCGAILIDTILITVLNDCNNSTNSDIFVSPNPNNGEFSCFYDLLVPTTFELYNSIGQLIMTQEMIAGKRKENFQMIEAKGIYFWRVKNGEYVYKTGKFVIVD